MFEFTPEQWSWIIAIALAVGLVAVVALAWGFLEGDIWDE